MYTFYHNNYKENYVIKIKIQTSLTFRGDTVKFSNPYLVTVVESKRPGSLGIMLFSTEKPSKIPRCHKTSTLGRICVMQAEIIKRQENPITIRKVSTLFELTDIARNKGEKQLT